MKFITFSKKKDFVKKQAGQATLILVLIVMSVATLIVAGMGLLTYNDIRSVGGLVDSSQSYYAAEAGLEDAILRIKNGMDYNPTGANTVTVGSGSVSWVSSGTDPITVTSTSNVDNRIRKIAVEMGVPPSLDFEMGNFDNAVQGGTGGVYLALGARINGNTYVNGTVTTGSGSNTFSGNVTSATNTGSGISPEHGIITAPTAPPSSINFCQSGVQDFGQSFNATTNFVLNKVSLYIKKTGSPASPTLRIVEDVSGVPSATSLISTTLTNSTVTTGYSWVEVWLTRSQPLQLTSGKKYWLIIDSTSNCTSPNTYTIGSSTADSSYTAGTAKTGTFSASLTTATNKDAYFKVYSGFGGMDLLNGTSLTGQARANRIEMTSTTIGGNAYANIINRNLSSGGVTGTKFCQTSNFTPACTTSPVAADPTPLAFPVSDSNIDSFKSVAQPGGVGGAAQGPISLLTGTTLNLGNVTVNGGVTVRNGSDLNINGTAKITGSVTVSDEDDDSNMIITGAAEIDGSVTVDALTSDLTIGPAVIGGDLIVTDEATLTITGPIYVKGNLRFQAGSLGTTTIKVDPSFNEKSGIIIVDGTVEVDNRATFLGSGHASSFLMLISTNDCDGTSSPSITGKTCIGFSQAIDFDGVSGGPTGKGVILAPYGKISAADYNVPVALIAKRVELFNSTIITYNSSLASLDLGFDSGSGGGSTEFKINSWKEIE